jgi:hypothetical protein
MTAALGVDGRSEQGLRSVLTAPLGMTAAFGIDDRSEQRLRLALTARASSGSAPNDGCVWH